MVSVENDGTQPYRPDLIERGGQIYSSKRRPTIRKPAQQSKPAAQSTSSKDSGKQND